MHNLAVDANGVVAMAYNKVEGTPWHNLGYAADGPMSTLEALIRGGLDYEVSKQDMYIQHEGKSILVPDKQAIVRNDDFRVLGVVGNRYNPIQNRESFNFFDAIVEQGEACIETVGALGNGEKVWIMAKLPKDIIVKNDVLKTYLLLYNAHDGSSTLKARFVNLRVVCQNTLFAAMREHKDIEVSIRHTNNAKDKLEMAHKLLGIVSKQRELTQIDFDRLVAFDVTEKQIDDYVSKLYPIKENEVETTRGKNIRLEVKELIHTGKGNEGKTAWDCYNGAVEFIDFNRSVRGAEMDNSNRLRWESATFGSGYALKTKAFEEAMELVKV